MTNYFPDYLPDTPSYEIEEYVKERFQSKLVMTQNDIELLNPTISITDDYLIGQLRAQLQGYLWAEHHYDVIEYPASWWDYTKMKLGFKYATVKIPQRRILLHPEIRDTSSSPTLRKAKIVTH